MEKQDLVKLISQLSKREISLEQVFEEELISLHEYVTELVERDEAQEISIVDDRRLHLRSYTCPNCGELAWERDAKHCHHCGQKLDWSKTE